MAVSFSSGVSIENGVRLVQPPALITISSQPTNNTVNYGANATFGVTASITRGAVLTYQWQYNHYGQGSWSDISGANTSTYTVNSVTTSANNDAYRVVLTGTLSANSVTSNTARLYVTPAVITINTQPSSNSVNEGQTASFSVSASVTLNATLSYQWQRNDGSYWTNVSGATSNTYTTGSLTNADDNNDVYRVFVSADKGATGVYSSNATLTVTSSVIQNSIDVVSYNGAYGAGDGTQSYIQSGTAFGTVTSNSISSIAYYASSEVGPKTVIELKDGTYSGFTVLNGAISNDGYTFDSPGDRRTFTIGGTNYVFQYDGNDAYFKNGTDPLGLQSAVGTNVTAVYEPVQQSTYGLGITPDYINYMSSDYYGANRNYNASYMNFGYLPIFGNIDILGNNYIDRLYYNGYDTIITMKPGSYMWGSPQKNLTVGSSGQIGSDTNGTSRYFKVGGTNQTLSYNSSSGNYTVAGDVWNLSSSLGQLLSLEYDPSDQPAQGGGGGGGGSIVTYTAGTDYADGTSGPPGVSLGQSMNQLSFIIIPNFWTNTTGSNTLIALTSGSTVNVVVSGTTYTATLTADMAPNYSSYYSPVTFSPSLSFPDQYTSYIPTSVSTTVTGGGGGTYVADTDFDPGTNGPPGLSIGGQQGQYTITIFNSGWTNTTARDLILSKPSGTVFTAIIGGYTRTVTMTSGWTSFNGGAGSYAPVTADGMLYGSTTSITVPGSGGSSGGGGGGGGGTTNVTLWSGTWDTSGMVSFQVQASDTANIALMDAIPSGATLTITDNNNNTTTVTLLGGLTKGGPGGPPSNQRYFWDGTATTTNPNFPNEYIFITSLTY